MRSAFDQTRRLTKCVLHAIVHLEIQVGTAKKVRR